MKVSFVIVTYNSADTIEDCVQSILDQNLDSFEVLIVDNHSTDKTVVLLESRFKQLTIIQNRKNLGFGVANNIGASNSTGETLAMVNPDVRLDRNWSTQILEGLHASARVGAAEGKLLFWKEPTLMNCRKSRTNLLGFGCMVGYREQDTPETALEEVSYPSGAAFMIKRSAFSQIGGFDEDYFLYHDDVDLGMRLYAAGWTVINVSTARAYHDFKPRLNPNKIFYLERNRWTSIVKNLPISYFFRSGPLHLLNELGLAIYLCRTGLLPAKLRAVQDFIKLLPRTLKKRQVASRQSSNRKWWMSVLGEDFPRLLPYQSLTTRTAKRIQDGYYRAFFRNPVQLDASWDS